MNILVLVLFFLLIFRYAFEAKSKWESINWTFGLYSVAKKNEYSCIISNFDRIFGYCIEMQSIGKCE